MRYILLASKLMLVGIIFFLFKRSNVLNNKEKIIDKRLFVNNLLFELLVLAITLLMYSYAQMGTSYVYGYNCCLTHNGCVRYLIGWVGYIVFLPSVYIAFIKESVRRQRQERTRKNRRRRRR